MHLINTNLGTLSQTFLLTLIFLKVSIIIKEFNLSLFKQSKKLEYNEWKLNSMLTRFMIKYCDNHGKHSLVIISLISSHYKVFSKIELLH